MLRSGEKDETCLKSIKRRMLDNYYQKCYSEINNSSKHKSYTLFKHAFNREQYWDFIKDPYLKYSLAKFRTCAHELAIETGRYTNTPQNERLCRSRNINLVESEYPFLLVCPKYRELRTTFFKPYYRCCPSLNKFASLICSYNNKTIYNIFKFIYFANQIRIS